MFNLIGHQGPKPGLRLLLKGFVQVGDKKFGESTRLLGSTIGIIRWFLTPGHLVVLLYAALGFPQA